MSGTSLDGIDAALLKTDGIKIDAFGPGLMMPYDQDFRDHLRSALRAPFSSMNVLEQELTERHIHAVKTLMEKSSIQPDLIGFHGQTVYHRPRTSSSPAQSRQIGKGPSMRQSLGIPVVYDFRQQDIQHGGEGAPLVPIFHQALSQNLPKPLAIVNIGGVTNLTFLTEKGLYAGDVGPGCALIDDWMYQRLQVGYDDHGQTAAKGAVHGDLLTQWLKHPFFYQPFPKSLDRLSFVDCLEGCKNLNTPDGAATLTVFTAQALLQGLQSYGCQRVILTGGGRHNVFLKKILSEHLHVQTTEDLHWQGDLLEAQAFAYLAVRSLYNLPLTFPTTTGVKSSISGGKVLL